MPAGHAVDPSSSDLARRALLTTSLLSLVGSGLGVVGIGQGVVTGSEIPLILSCVLFASGALLALLTGRRVALQTLAMVSTIYFALYLCLGSVLAITGSPTHHLNLFIFLVWFFPLLVFNKLVNAPAAGRFLAKTLVLAPIVIVGVFLPRLAAIFPLQLVLLSITYCISYFAFGTTLHFVTRYREEFVAERERAESLKIESAVLESISDCFIALDSDLRLTYLNDAACTEFALDRSAALSRVLTEAVPGFFSEPMLDGLRTALHESTASVFEMQDRAQDRWYEMRCFPRPDGLSIYFRNVSNRRAADAKIQHLAFYDALTDLPNRTLLRERLQEALESTVRHRQMAAILYLDLDDFKTLNDTLGHDTGDNYLREVAVRLTACVGRNDIVARFGGDEFMVLLEGIGYDEDTAGAQARVVADKILDAFAKPYRIAANEHSSTACIGITLLSGQPDTVDDLLKRADLAMYRAKALGRNHISFFDPAMRALVAARAALQADLRVALLQHEFTLYYQPLVDRNARVTGAEALLRWKHPRRGMVSPAEFIPLAEEAGLIIELGRWVLATACGQLALWAGRPETESLTVAVNVSLRQFIDPNFVALVLAVLRETRADPHRLKLELTESSAMENVDDTIAKMTALKAHGIGFSIDDFGTGYSSLSHLKRLPLDQLKIDRSFVNDVMTDAKDASIVRTLIALARNLDLSVIAEGVETDGQRRFLEVEGCHFYQGYFFSPALPSEEFDAFTVAANMPSALPISA